MSAIEKIRASDALILLDTVQYSHGGWSNRNKMPDGSWLTVPIDRASDMAPFNRVKISEHGTWRKRAARTLYQQYGPAAADIADELHRPYGLLIGLNLALLRIVTSRCGIDTDWHFQSHLDGGHAVRAVSDSSVELRPISDRLARMVKEVGGTTYLSGPSGRNYLDEMPFHVRGIAVEYFAWPHANPCCVSALTTRAAA